MNEEKMFKMELTKEQAQWVIDQEETEKELRALREEVESAKMSEKDVKYHFTRLTTLVGLEWRDKWIYQDYINTMDELWRRLEAAFPKSNLNNEQK